MEHARKLAHRCLHACRSLLQESQPLLAARLYGFHDFLTESLGDGNIHRQMTERDTERKVKALCKLYDQSFWLYTVIIALAIQQVLLDILPRLLNRWFSAGLPLPTPELNPSAFHIQLARSIVFLVVITRFYLGGVLVFEKLSQTPGGPPKGSWIHVLSGTVHFLLFFGWAYTPFITVLVGRVSVFIFVLLLILLWDVVWFGLASRSRNQRTEIKPWLYRNLRTIIYLMLAFFLTLWWFSAQTQEVVMLAVVVVISIRDFWEMFTKREPPARFFAIL